MNPISDGVDLLGSRRTLKSLYGMTDAEYYSSVADRSIPEASYLVYRLFQSLQISILNTSSGVFFGAMYNKLTEIEEAPL